MTQYLVPMKVTQSGFALVDAESPDEARKLCEAGRWDILTTEGGEVSDWDVTATPVEN